MARRCTLHELLIMLSCIALLCGVSVTNTARSQSIKRFANARQAFAEILKGKPMVLGVGEYHQTEPLRNTTSAISRFTRELLPLLKGRTKALILETWVKDGNCGEVETRANNNIQQTTKRPETTEDEIVTLIKTSQRANIQPKILTLSCDDYRSLFPKNTTPDKQTDEELDYEKLLTLITSKLKREIHGTWLMERTFGAATTKRPLIVVYGGALHNDLKPKPQHQPWSYPVMLRHELQQDFIEVDLIVPELVKDDPTYKSEPWFQQTQLPSNRQHTWLVTRGPRSFVIVFAHTTPRGGGNPRRGRAAREPSM